MAGDDWKDGSISRDAFQEYAEYMAELSAEFMRALQAKGFSREEALRLTISLVPGGFNMKELLARNLSAALREVMNARMVALHSTDGLITEEVTDSIVDAEVAIEKAQAKLAEARPVSGDRR